MIDLEKNVDEALARRDAIARAWGEILAALGYDTTSPHLRDTPGRVAKFLQAWHTNATTPPPLTTFPAEGYDEIVLVGGIRFHSLCAHHALPFFGHACVGYIPGRCEPKGCHPSVVGLSKLARVVDHFARRFTTQEQIGLEVADHLEKHLQPLGVGVVLRAEHLCMSMRGIERPGHGTTTSVMRGVFRTKPEARAELLALVAR